MSPKWRRLAFLATSILIAVATATTALAQAATPVSKGLNWLALQQKANGTWATVPELAPRDTSRALIALSLHKSTSPAVAAGLGWLGSQRGFDANQFLAEQTLALSNASMDSSAGLEKLSSQRSFSGPDYGGFADHTGTSYDSALALQALATREVKYLTPIAGVVTTLITRQNPDGGWGMDTGFASHPVITAEVLTALSSTAAQQAPPATVAAAQTYLSSLRKPDGSYGNSVLETVTAFRALALSGYPLSATATSTLNYLGAQQAADGSWGGDVYLTARVLEAFAANKSNLTIKSGDFTLNPATVTDGANVSATVIVTNIGSAISNAATSVKLFSGENLTRELVSTGFATLGAGLTRTVTLSFAATSLVGVQTITAVVDNENVVDEMRNDDNKATAKLTVAGKPDLQVFSADIVTAPARLQPSQEGALNITIRNNGEGDATNAGYAIYQRTGGGAETLLKKATVETIAAEGAAVVSLPITLPAGTHTIRVVADPDAQITESNESNNQATKSISVAAAANVDLRIRAGEVWTDPTRPTEGQSFGIVATVDNAGLEKVTSKVAFYDGVPNAGGVVIAVLPITINAQSNAQVQVTHVATATSRVVYAVADPDDLIPEVDEANNAGHALLTDQYADVVLTREGFVIPRATLSNGAKLDARLVVRNTGSLPADNVRVVVHDDLPQNGGIKVLDTTINVPAMGKTVVPVSWNVRAGQRFATAEVNGEHTVFEPSYENNRVTKLYTPKGPEADVRVNGTRANGAIDATGLVVDQSTLTISGNVAVNITTNVPRAFTVTLFQDVDGDLAFNAEADNALGSTLVNPSSDPQHIVVGAQGTVRFAPGKLVLHLDSSNAIAEDNEANNFVDVWQDCINQSSFLPGIKWRTNEIARNLAPVARFRDTNGDDVVDDNDAPYIVNMSASTVSLRRGDNGQRLWIRNFGFFGRQISPAIGDLDGDGVAEILASTYQNRIVALDVDGNLKWQSPELPIHPDWEFWLIFKDFTYVGAPVIADLDGDGAVEVIVGKAVLNGANGTIKWIGGGNSGRAFVADSQYDLYNLNFPDQEAPITVDLDGDGKLEVVAGSTAYRPDGTILWHRGELGDGYTGAVTLPNQTRPFIALVANGRITMLRNDGTTLWGPVNLPNGARMGGAPTVFTEGGTQWVGVAGDGWYTVFNANTGAVRWTKQTTDDFSFGIITTNAATAFDFQNGMGMILAYAARNTFYLLRASDGAVMYSMPNNQSCFFPTAPVVADVDGDGRTDIAVPGNDGMKILSDPSWNGTRSVFNQLSYNVVNVESDRATIPKVVVPTAYSKTHFRTNAPQTATAVGVTGQPNLAASYMRADTSNYPASVKLIVRAGNNGWLQAIDTKVAFYRVSGTTPTFIGTSVLRDLPPGDYEDVTFTYNNPPADTTAFYAVVDDGGTANSGEVAECNESDNKSQNVSVRLTTDIFAPALVISDAQPRRGETIELVANAEISSAVNPANVRAQFFLGDPNAGGTAISAPLPVTVATDGDKRIVNATTAWNVTAPTGPQTLFVVFDPQNAIVETDETNNKASFAVTVGASVGQPDLQVFAADINTTPARLQPGQQATITVTIRNAGKGDAGPVSWKLFDVVGATSTLLAQGTTNALPIGAGQIVSATATLAGGTHSIRAVVDPDNAIAESNETNNDASRQISVSVVSNVDLKVASVTATPSRPTAGQSIAIKATVENGGSEAAESNLGFYDGVPGHGGHLIALVPLVLDAQSSTTIERTYTVTASSIVVYAVADPDDVLPEIDESNNAANAVLTDNYTDLAVTRDEIALSATNVSAGQTLTATITVRNRGLLAATAVPVAVYDDAPASGGRVVYETTVNVPGQGSAVVTASFAARAGQRFAVVTVNADGAIVETDFSNNRATRFYTGSGDEPDLSLDTTVARNVAIDTTGVTVDGSELSIAGTVKLRLNTPGTKTFTVLVFEDADGDLAYDSVVDNALGSAIVNAGATPQVVNVPVQGTLRFVPGKLAVYIDSSNAVSETDESNNLLELWQDCRNGDLPRPNLTASYMRVDGSGYPGSARFIARVGNNGLLQSPGTGVAFYGMRNGAAQLLGRTGVPGLRPGQYADIVFTLSNPPADITAAYAVADDTGTASSLSECNESDNTTPTVPVQFSTDIVVDQAMLLVTDPQPRQGDAIDLIAVAQLKGAISATPVTAQFYLGNPSTGGTPISGVLNATTSSRSGSTSATVSFRWIVTAGVGPQAVYVVFDPNNAIAEDDETNNRGIYSINVTSPEPVLKLSGTITLDPPAAEPGAKISIQVLVKNIGNVPLDNVTLQYAVTGGAGTGFNGSATIASLLKNGLVILNLGAFTPASAGEYTVTVTPSNPAITLIAGGKAIKIAPFAAAAMTAAPRLVPVSVPLVQAHTTISRGNTIVIPDDPLVPLLKTHIQRGLNWQAAYINADLNTDFCFRCHVTAQGMVSFEESRKVSGVTVNETVAERIFQSTAQNQWTTTGQWHDGSYRRTTTAVGAWALSYFHDSERAKLYLTRSLNGMLDLQNKGGSQDGAWECDHCYISYGSREAHTMMGIIAMARGWEITKDQRYFDSMMSAVNWAMRYDWQGNAVSRGPEWAARISIGLSAALPQITDEAVASTVRNRIDTIAAFLRSTQQPDGSFGTFTSPDEPIIRNSQCLYALSLAGVPGSDASIRTAIVWLINHQQPNGAWREVKADTNQEHWVDETTWAMIALPAAFLRLGQFDVDYEVFLPATSEYVSASPVPLSVNPVTGGKQLKWKLKDVTEAGQELLLNVNLTGIRNNEQRPVVGRATLNYTHPYTGERTSRDLDIPQVTGFAPLRLSIATDKPSYAPNTAVEITEVMENVGAATVGVTNDVIIRDDNATKVATVVTNDVIDGFPADPFPAWNYTIPVSAPITQGGVNRTLIVPVDFAQKLAALGVSETFDTNSIRVSADNAAATELPYSFVLTNTATPAAGKLFITIPDSAAAGATLALHIYFDTAEHGFKPVSMYDRSRVSNIGSTGLVSNWWATDQSRTYWNVIEPSELVPLGNAITVPITNTHTGSYAPAGLPADFFFTIWTGAIYVPTTGTYWFASETDDGSWLDIDGVRVVSNPGAHGVVWRDGSRFLTAGIHQFRYTFYEVNYSHWLRLWWAPPGQGWQAMSGSTLLPAFPAADESTVVVAAAQKLTHGTVTRKFIWNTGTTSAGPYSVLGTLNQFGSFVTDASAAFSITPAAQVSGTIATDKAIYDSGETVRVTAGAQYTAGNTTLTNLRAVVSILDASGAVKATNTTAIASLVPGQTANARLDWPAGTSAPGAYTAKLVVLDSSGAQLAETSTGFELRSSAVSGKGVTGTIGTPATVQQGEPLPIAISITNGGNTALVDAPFVVTILDPATQSAVATLHFTASIAAGATFTTDLTHSTAGMPVQTYQAYLVSMITGSAVPLSNSTFEVKPPPLKLEISTGGPARVLIWADCANGNSAQPCTAVAPPFLTATLTSAGIPWTLVGTQDAALAALRTGAYDEAILYQKGPYEAKIFEELVESVRGGLGLFLIKAHGDAVPQLAPALGTKFSGKLNASSTLLDLLSSPFTAPRQLTLNGDGVKIELDGAKAAANIAATQAPAISYNTFGAGRVVVVPFDLEQTTTADAGKLIVDAVNHVARTHTYDARQVVPIDLFVTPPPGAPANLTIGVTLPEGMSVVHAAPALSSTDPVKWNVTSNGEPFHLYLWVRLPDAAGTVTITATAGFAGQIPVVTKTLSLTVVADRAAIEAALTADLNALAAAAPSNDAKSINDAQTHFAALKAAAPADAEAAVARVLQLINALQKVSIDTTAARNDADRLLVWWQSRS